MHLMTLPLFSLDDAPEIPSPAQAAESAAGGKPRLRLPIRNQIALKWFSLDDTLEFDHEVRKIWVGVCRFDLSSWLSEIKAVEGHVGRDATDPRLLVALWIYATSKGISSARELGRLCRESLPYQWLCGGVSVNYHMLSSFRSRSGEKWDELLTQSVGILKANGLVTLERVAQDGMRVRASAGKSSFHREASLKECLEEAREQVETLKHIAETNPGELTRRQLAARQRAAIELEERAEDAGRQWGEMRAQREAQEKRSGREAKEPRASTTDPDARIIKFADGGFWPAYNVQFSTDTGSGVIVGVEVTNAGTDSEQLTPMLDQLEKRYEAMPAEVVVDGGFATIESIENAAERNCTAYAPLKDKAKQEEAGKDPHARKKGDSDAIADWRSRMGTELGKTIYLLRCQTAEWVNAQCRNRGLFIGLLYAITHNLVVTGRLRPELMVGTA
jgi:transposase